MEVLQRTANRGSISTGYDIDNSCKFEADNSEYLSKTPSSAGNRKTWTLSAWVKRTELTTESNSAGNQNMILSAGNTYIQFDGNAIWVNFRAASENFFLATNRLFRDTSAWYHVVLQCDTTQGTASNRAKLWVNGVQETSFQNSTYDGMPLNYDTLMNSTNEHEVGKSTNEETTYANLFNGYMAEMHLVDGTALTPTSFGEFDDDSGIWKPKAYAGSYGTNGFYLDFKDSANLGNDASGGTDFAETNITSADQATDTPTNNFATLNPLIIHGANDYFVITEGGTNIIQSAQVGWGTMTANIAVNSGKWYAEIKSASSLVMIGNSQVDDPVTYSVAHLGQLANTTSLGMGYYNYSGNIYRNAGDVGYGVAWDSGDIMGIALEFKSDGTANMYVAENNVWINSADPAAGTGGVALNYGNALPTGLHFTFAVALHNNTGETEVNFGGFTTISISSAATDANGYGTFEYAPPTGYYALCTKNLAEYG